MQEMKDSGIEWIGEIPTHWSTAKLKYLTNVRNENGLFRPDSALYIGLENVVGYLNTIIPTDTDYDVSTQSICKMNDVLFGKLRPYLAKVIIAPFDGFCSSEFLVFSEFAGDRRFLRFCLLNKKLIDNINSSTYGAKMPRANSDYLLNLMIAFPPLPEQRLIASFLDAKCAEIDALTADIQTQIDTLEQYKRSFITETVTKGLNHNVEMKNSGIEWIGKIPAHWKTMRIGRLFHLRDERNCKPLKEVQLLSLYTGIGVFPHGEQEERGNKAITADGYKIVKVNDIIVNIILAWMGAIGVSNYDGVTSPAYDVYVPDLSKVVPHYFHYVFRTSGIAGECYKYGRGIMAMRWRTYSSEFKRIFVPYPDMYEQKQIADYLDTKCAEIDEIIKHKRELITTIEEYKKSLIFEYVTGKKEVPTA